MLRTYSFADNENWDVNIIDKNILDRERQLIIDFALSNPTHLKRKSCIACGGETKDFATVFSTNYQRCKTCYTIFAPVKREIAERYKSYQPLVTFRNSDEYQGSAEKRREGVWDDLLFWIEYRLARYMGRNSGIDVIDVSNRYRALADKVKHSKFCGSYNSSRNADVVLYFDQLRCQCAPSKTLAELKDMLKDNGILIMNMRVGSGFDILTLKGCTDNLIPYECIFLPSIEGLEIILKSAGFDVLEISTPGTLDIEHILQNKDKLNPDDLFVDYLLNKSDRSVLIEFQRFLQKSGMSSHARVIARKL